MSETSQILPCVMIPMTGQQLLLPNVSIAEIIDYASVEPRSDAPQWLLGDIQWRGLTLPVISYDAANGIKAGVPAGSRGRVAVLNTIGEHHNTLPFLAIVTQGIPSQARVASEQVQEREGETGPADLMLVEVDGESARIPNLEYLESLALQAHRG
ncbi:chemotaxis protein CheW [Marinobacter mobilis]|uniref:Chemosensory pili system protein ChpC n=1 Tax=Marinobacter mobilis TaxID=488533 RepID=A0A1H3DNN4_9GAMM|nr:chemotaxis protein CheW [Marinobacter mobilis]SDW85536.1 chemosensory pili system protein ChpC [Marinobacter mobilis]SDX67274.1 chemosensory pili system protein ChpC [Marinobacter mobilis]